MSQATNISAQAVRTAAWLGDPANSIVVPVYQRQYRWDIGGCEQLLNDIKEAGRGASESSHFIGSVLSSHGGKDDAAALVLIDGQQRITTLMLLIAALKHSTEDPQLSHELDRILFRPDKNTPKLLPHRAWADTYQQIISGTLATTSATNSRFENNYAFFRSQIRADDIEMIWNGLQKLEHVSITLSPAANAQQIFESLNSTGEPLKDHELIHNYVLMGLSHSQQLLFERNVWAGIEKNTGDNIAQFWEDYLVSLTGRELNQLRGRGSYAAFQAQFPHLDQAVLQEVGESWLKLSESYAQLRQPESITNANIAEELQSLNSFGKISYPLTLSYLTDWQNGLVSDEELILVLRQLQSLFLRREIVGLNNERIVARLVRARAQGSEAVLEAIAKITPSDDRIRAMLKFTELPRADYVLRRLAKLPTKAPVQVVQVLPLMPAEAWNNGTQTWSELNDDLQNSHRALAGTLGNLSLLEEELAEAAFDKSYPQFKSILSRSEIELNSSISAAAWNTRSISERTAELSAAFIESWPRLGSKAIDDDGLTPILDAKIRRGWPAGWQREFAYVEYRGEHWQEFNIRDLFNRIFKRLWLEEPELVTRFTTERGGPVYFEQAWNGQWDAIDGRASIYMGWDSSYMLLSLQDLLQEAGSAAEVFIKYSHIGDAMG